METVHVRTGLEAAVHPKRMSRARAHMIRHGISMRGLSVHLDIHERTVQAIINGYKKATAGYASRIAKALRIPDDWLHDRKDYILPEPVPARAPKKPGKKSDVPC